MARSRFRDGLDEPRYRHRSRLSGERGSRTFASLAMVLNGIATAVLVPAIVGLLDRVR
jgi:hypothetical protein